MNRIVEMRTSVRKIPLKRTFTTAVRSTSHIDSLMIELVLDSGNIGFGMVPATTAVTGDTLAGMDYIIHELFAPVIKGTLLSEYKETLDEAFKRVMFNTGAKMAVDLAFHDLLAKQANVSVAKLLGAKLNTIETDVSIACGSIDETINNVQNGVEAGFNAIKVKTGADFGRDIKLLSQLEKEFSKEIKFRFDANQGWSLFQTRQFIDELNKYNINTEIIEQPVKYYDIAAMKELTQFSNIPIVADESVFSTSDAERVINERACNIINIKLAKTGGILEAQKIKHLADRANLPCMIGCMMESPFGILAAASFAISENITIADLDPLDWVDSKFYDEYIDFNCPSISLKDKVIGFGFNGIL